MKATPLRRGALVLLPLLALVLEFLPSGVVMYFANQELDGSIGRIRETAAYFSFLPFGYGNFGPLLTAALTCALLFAVPVYLIAGAGRGVLKGLSAAAFLLSLTPFLWGLDHFSPVGAAISAALGAAMWLAFTEKEAARTGP